MVSIELRNTMLISKMKYIRYILYKYTGRNDDDEYHNAIARLARDIDKYDRSKGSLNTWLWINTRSSLGRKRVGVDRLVYVDSEDIERASCNITPFTELLDAEYDVARSKVVSYAMSKLDSVDSWLVYQYIWKKRTQRDIGIEEGVTTQAIQARLTRIFKSMRTYIEDNWIDDIR